MPQKQKPSENCEGRGSFACDFHGIREFESVEGKIAKFFINDFGAQQAKITWLGGEDESSLVMGDGRPFFAKLVNPHRRNFSGKKKVDLDGVSISGLRMINKIPSEPVRFRTLVELEVEAEGELPPRLNERIKKLGGRQVTLYEASHKNRKTVYNISAKRMSQNTMRIRMESDGGMPIKRFVSGQDVEPSISSLVGSNCRCVRFDFRKITVTRSP